MQVRCPCPDVQKETIPQQTCHVDCSQHFRDDNVNWPLHVAAAVYASGFFASGAAKGPPIKAHDMFLTDLLTARLVWVSPQQALCTCLCNSRSIFKNWHGHAAAPWNSERMHCLMLRSSSFALLLPRRVPWFQRQLDTYHKDV